MAKSHPKNERIKHRYAAYLEDAKRMSPKTTEKALASIRQLELANSCKDFASFHIEHARRFKRVLQEARKPKSGTPLAKATIHSRLNEVKAFFMWLADQPGYRSRIRYSDCDYFNPSANDSRVATARCPQRVPDLDQILHVIELMPCKTTLEKRDRALLAFTLLSGARDDAVASLNIGHVDLERRVVFQDARSVRTKNRKTISSWFFPVGADIEAIVAEWVLHLRDDFHFGDDDPLFPCTRVALDDNCQFAAAGVERRHWKNAGRIRKIFKQAFEAAGLPYFPPHSFRKTLARLGERMCRTPEEFKAWSQNLGHEHVLTTFTSYGQVENHRQGEIMSSLSNRKTEKSDDAGGNPSAETIARVVTYLSSRTGS